LEPALSVEALPVAMTIDFYVLGGRDGDCGAVLGGDPDERRASVLEQAAGLVGAAMAIAALLGFVFTTALRTST
jgi:hypothetical protein